MTGFVIGIGEGWPGIAAVCARRMEAMTGIKSHVLTEDPFGLCHPSWLKCKIPEMFPDEKAYFIYDADILPLKPWKINLVENIPAFIGVKDRATEMVIQEQNALEMGSDHTYINCGLMIFNQGAKGVVTRAIKRHPVYGNWLEQGAINKDLSEQPGLLELLPMHFNCHVHPRLVDDAIEKGIVNAHLTGLRGRWDLVEECHRKLGWSV